MKKILVRAGFDPHKTYNPYDYITKGFVGNNSGNLLFAYGVLNILNTEETIIEQTYKCNWSDKEAEYINDNYSAFILPMADGFRQNFIPILNGFTALINRLKIPVIVIGVGYRTSYEPDFSTNRELDEAVTNFVKAVLNHSTQLGLRGEITGKYLKKLGFRPEVDYTPIGCPSLYTYGNAIHTKDLNDIHNLVFNTSIKAQKNVDEMTFNTLRRYPNHWMIQQEHTEFLDMFIGQHTKWGKPIVANVFDNSSFKKLNAEDRIRFFFDVPSWVNYMKDFDFFFGTRFHGSVAAILAGLPHVIIPIDGRMREMSEYHNITRLSPIDINGDSDIDKYLSKLDFKSTERKQKENLEHYVDFLETNGLDHIFKKKQNYNFGESPMERKMENKIHVIHTIESLSFLDKMVRLSYINHIFIKRKIYSLMNKL